MLDKKTFKSIVKNTPLVSIDLCLVYKDQILLCKRNNKPLKDSWFTPGGRVYKNEFWHECLIRVAETELGLKVNDIDEFKLMGLWDHFYSDSIFGDSISTHYLNLPHYIVFDEKPILKLDQQHDKMKWYDISKVAIDNNFHEYIRNYALWLKQL